MGAVAGSIPTISRSIIEVQTEDRLIPSLAEDQYLFILSAFAPKDILLYRTINRSCFRRVFRALNGLSPTQLVEFLNKQSARKLSIPPAFYLYLLDHKIPDLWASALTVQSCSSLNYLTRPIGRLTLSGNENNVNLAFLCSILAQKQITDLTLGGVFDADEDGVKACVLQLGTIVGLQKVSLYGLPVNFPFDEVSVYFKGTTGLEVSFSQINFESDGFERSTESSLSIYTEPPI